MKNEEGLKQLVLYLHRSSIEQDQEFLHGVCSKQKDSFCLACSHMLVVASAHHHLHTCHMFEGCIHTCSIYGWDIVVIRHVGLWEQNTDLEFTVHSCATPITACSFVVKFTHTHPPTPWCSPCGRQTRITWLESSASETLICSNMHLMPVGAF